MFPIYFRHRRRRAMLLVKKGGRWPAKLHDVVTVRAIALRKAIYRSPLGSWVIEETSI